MSVVALLAVLAFAVARPWRLPEAVAAVPAAVLVVAVGALPVSRAWAQVTGLLPVVGFLAAVLVLAQLCDDDGLFTAAGDLMAQACRGRPERLLAGVFVLASLVTAVLSLDATVVLLTPVVFATAARSGVRPRPHVYACTHLANSASLLLPVSNLTNLLAFRASGLSFARFGALMALPWLVAIGIEYAVFRRFFRADLAASAVPAEPVRRAPLPVFTLVVLAGTLAGFALVSLAGLSPAWAALAGAAVLSARALARRATTPGRLVSAAGPLFCLFVLALGVVVKAVVDNGLGTAAGRLLPHGPSLLALLAVAGVAAVLANVINNLPAVLALAPLVAAGGPGPVLAVLIGVNLGPNLTYVGSLATLLWRRVLHERDEEPALGDFTRLGLAAVPATLAAATVALWVMLAVIGGVGMRVVVWVTEGTWRAAVDAARTLAPPGAEFTLLHVTGDDVAGAAHAAFAGLLGRGRHGRDPGDRLEELSQTAAGELLSAAAERLGRPAAVVRGRGRVEREVVRAAGEAALLICARDGDRDRLGPRSLGPATRFVVDHAPCPVLLVWPREAPGIESLPPPPHDRR